MQANSPPIPYALQDNLLHKVLHLVFPDGHPTVKNWWAFQWWFVLCISLIFYFSLEKLRNYRITKHTKPLDEYRFLGLLATLTTVASDCYILYSIVMYYADTGLWYCHDILYSDTQIASVLWFFYLSRLCNDFIYTCYLYLTQYDTTLAQAKGNNFSKVSVAQNVLWWMMFYYYPGGETLWTVAVARVYHLATLLSATRIGSRTGNVIPLGVTVVGMVKYALNLWFSCSFSAATVPLMPPYHNSDAPLLMFERFHGIPVGFVYMYLLFGRGNTFTWSSSVLFMTAVYLPKLFEYRKQTANQTSSHKDKKVDLTKEGKGFIFKDGKVIETDAPEGVAQQFVIHSANSSKRKNVANVNVNNNATEDEDKRTPYQDLRKCSYFMCSNYETKPKSFKRCERCEAPYCSRKCQKDDWDKSNHKYYCKQFRDPS